jgi:ABC-type multidrug transport system ATPase subunit
LFAHIFSEVLSDVSSGIYSYNEILKKFGFELKKDNNRDKNLLPEDYGDFEECPSKIPDSKKLVEFIKECLPDFEPNRFIFDLSKILELDYKINKASRETVNKPLKFLYKKINYELSQEYKGEKPFRWQLHEPSIHRSYTLSFESHNQSSKHVPFKHLSTGERIIFELLCYKYLITDKSAKDKEQQKPNLLILDEFDANLNPKLSQMYLKILYELTEYGVTIFLSTHSSDTVCSAIEHPKKDDKMRLYWLDLEKNTLDDTIDNVEILKKLSPSWESIHEKINQLEQQKSQSEQKNQALEKELQNLKPQKVFICEDEGGVQFWKSIFENFPGLNDVQVFSSKGCANNQHEIILNGIRSRDNTYNPKIFRQLDRDGLDNDLSKELENKLKKKYTEDASKFKFYQVKILPVCEIENFDLLSFYRKDACSKSKIDKSIKSLSKTIYSEIRNNLSGKIEGKIGKNKGKEEYEKLLRKNDDLVNNGDDVLNYIKYFPGKQIKKELKIKHNMPSDYKTINDYSKEFGDYFEKIKSFFEGASGAK